MYEKLNNFKQEAEKQYTRLQEKLAKVKDKFARMQNNLTQQIALIQRQLQEKETYLQQKQAYLSLKQMYSTGMSTEKGAHAKAVGAISDASSSVDSVIESCKCADENESLSKTACKTACDFDSDFVKDRNASKCAPDTKKGSSHSDQKI